MHSSHFVQDLFSSADVFYLFQLMNEKKDVKKSPLIETTTTGDNNQSLKPLKR